MIMKKTKFEPINLEQPYMPYQPFIPKMPMVYVDKALEKGMGLPPIKESFISQSEYGAKCMLIGYEYGQKKAKKKYKKRLKRLKAMLEENNNKALGILKTIEKNDITGLSFAFEPTEEEDNDSDRKISTDEEGRSFKQALPL